MDSQCFTTLYCIDIIRTDTTSSPIYTLFFPFRIDPYTDGRSWARKKGFEHHRGVRLGEELTDDDEDEAGNP